MRRLASVLLCAAVLIGVPTSVGAQSLDQHSPLPININRFLLWVTSNDHIGGNFSLVTAPAGGLGSFPVRSAPVLYSDNLLWGGYVNDSGTPELRVTGAYYVSAMAPGAILSPGVPEYAASPSARVFRIKKDWRTADLRTDAAELLNVDPANVSEEEIAALRARYKKDWLEWPVDRGAPFNDTNGNALRDPDEEPGLLDADMVLWYVMNDLDTGRQNTLYSAAPTGMEVQGTIWAYKGSRHVPGNAVFQRYRLIYKGTATSMPGSTIRDMYITKYADTDLGSFGDDLLGCDTTLQLGYTYNGRALDGAFVKAGIPYPPAVGYTLLQGPLVAGDANDVAWFDLTQRSGHRNLSLSSIIAKWTGTGISDPPLSAEGGIRMYRWMRGYIPDPSNQPERPYFNPDGTVANFMFSGDPVKGSGALDGGSEAVHPVFSEWSGGPGSRRFLMSTGPFTMTLGDTQEVVYALVGASGASGRLPNITYLKWLTKFVRQAYPDLASLREYEQEEEPPPEPLPADYELCQNYPNPFNPGTTISYALPDDGRVQIVVYDMLGRQVRVLEDAVKTAGQYTVSWDGQDREGKAVASGVYLYRFTAGGMVVTKRMMVLR